MTKFCSNCKTENPDDFLICKNCKVRLKDNKDGIKIGLKTLIVFFIILFVILFNIGSKIYDKNVYETVSLSDKKTDITVVEFKLPKKWVPIGKVIHNPKSIPNMYTFFAAAINPKENVDFQFFSTQYETDNGEEFQKKGTYTLIKSENYIKDIITKISPKAKNITLEAIETPDKKIVRISNKEKNFFTWLYSDINPGTTKGKSYLKDFDIIPFKYIFSYYENNKMYYQLIEGRYTFFAQCFSKRLEQNAPIHTAIKFIKCENIFSYKAEAELFKKYMPKYKVFQKNLKISPEWEKEINAQKLDKLSEISYITTNSLVGGDKFDREKFKNTIYYIEYLDENSKIQLKKNYEKTLKQQRKR